MHFELQHISKSFGKNEFRLCDIDLFAEKGEIIALLGESGSGKTTLLRIIAGFEVAETGTIRLNGKTICSDSIFLAPEKRKTGLVFQEHALFPHLNVASNIAFGMKTKSKEKIAELLHLVGLSGTEKRFPHELSGGQQQRIAIARSLAAEPDLLLLDEPFSNLDDTIKLHVRNEIRNIIKKSNTTSIFVTHDTRDCLAVADKVAVLQNGNLLQSGTPEALFNHPVSAYVAKLFGKINIVRGEVLKGVQEEIKAEKFYLIRPDQIRINDQSKISAKVSGSRFSGNDYEITVQLNSSEVIFYHTTPLIPGTIIPIEFTAPLQIYFDHEN